MTISNIKNSDFVIKEIPSFHPISQSYDRKIWWKEQIKRMIEGYWVRGRWMPGVLYMYINFWPIEIGGSKASRGKSIGRPWLRDVEWEKAYTYMEARGFSGFEDDSNYTCNELHPDGPEMKKLLNEGADLKESLSLFKKQGYITEEDIKKKYINPREYLAKTHDGNYGRPLFNNEAGNIIDLEAREGGKSFFAACCIGHNWIFDGAYNFNTWYTKRKSNEPLTSQTVVGAIESQYSSDLLKKFTLGYSNLPGEASYTTKEGRTIEYPSPLYVESTGSTMPAKSLVKKKSNSKIHHRTFKDNPLAANGTRPSLVCIEEVGFMDNVEETLGALKECVSESGRQFGTIWMFGTGGLTKGIAANYTKRIFYNPAEYNCLEFDDIWEGKGKIGMFFPKYRVLNQFKDLENSTSDDDGALDYLMRIRKSVENNNIKYATEVINNPIKPSEIFFSMDGLFFPTTDLKFALNQLESNKKLLNASYAGFCIEDEKGKIVWKNTNDKPLRDYNQRISKLEQGCIEIYQHPVTDSDGDVPHGIYLAGCDTVDDDDLFGSLQSTFIINRLTKQIVAEYTARHETAKEYYENLRKLLIYYNAKCNYENTKKGLYQYLETKNCTHLLCDTPKILKDLRLISKLQSKGNKAVGSPAPGSVNAWHRNLTKEWLLEQSFSDPSINNCYTIRSTALLEELLYWNPDGNFDRVSALGMTMILLQENAKRTGEMLDKKPETSLDRFDKYMLTKSILKNEYTKKVSQAEIINIAKGGKLGKTMY